VTLVGCANSYTLLFLCPIIYLNYFWCIKYQHINIYIYIYMKMGKRNGKRKRKGISCSLGRGGFGPAERECARGRGRRPSRPTKERHGAGRRRGRGPTRQREEGVNGAERRRRGGELVGSTAGDARGVSPPRSWFCDGEVVARHGWW
jgi:hypothetical protein